MHWSNIKALPCQRLVLARIHDFYDFHDFRSETEHMFIVQELVL